MHPYLDVVLEAFGAEPALIGSDWPVCTLAGDYARTLAVVVEWTARLPAAARERACSAERARVYGLASRRRSA